MQIHKNFYSGVGFYLFGISLYFLINPSNMYLSDPLCMVCTFKYYMFVKIGIVLLFIKFLLNICLEYIKNWFKSLIYLHTKESETAFCPRLFFEL